MTGQPPTKTSASTSRPTTSGEESSSKPVGKGKGAIRLGEEAKHKAAESSGEDDEEEEEDDDSSDDDDGDDDDDEPRLKYARLTSNIGSVYRNGDATSAFLVAGDKMIIGTHSGIIHVYQLPTFNTLRVYHAHSASVTGISISPFPPPLGSLASSTSPSPPGTGSPHAPSLASETSPAGPHRRPTREAHPVPNTPSNQIYIATSSLDGNVCIQNLIDGRDVQLRNFARPVQAVALSPDYKTDRTYLSGGLAGHLIATVGGGTGKSVSTTVGTAAATASGWLGSMGLGTNTGKDSILHTGEGTISGIKWSLSGRYAVWLNEHGFKIMRTKLHLEHHDAEDAWKRIGHIDRPQSDEWDEMASVWKGRVEWIDEKTVSMDDDSVDSAVDPAPSSAAARLRQVASSSSSKMERLLVGWGGTIWIIHVHPGGIGTGRNAGEKIAARAEIVKILRLDCIISGISLYTQNLLLVLAYCLPGQGDSDDEDDAEPDSPVRPKSHRSNPSTGSQPSGGIKRRTNNQPPELRLIDLNSQAEVDKDGLSVSRYERLSAADYHLGLLPAQTASAVVAQKGALEALTMFGTDMWNAAINPRSLFSSGASVVSGRSGEDATSGSKTTGSAAVGPSRNRGGSLAIHPNLLKPGVKIFIHSPYDCIVGSKRDLGDHLNWLLERKQLQMAWELLDDHPEILSAPWEKEPPTPTSPIPMTIAGKLSKTETDIDAQTEDGSTVASYSKTQFSAAEKEKRRIADLWLKELVDAGDWTEASRVCAKVVTTAQQWEKWIWAFAGAHKFDEIASCMPTQPLKPPIHGTLYEVILGHYIQNNKPKFKSLLGKWAPGELFDAHAVATALENQLAYRDVREDSIEDGVRGRDWHIVMESLARLYEACGRHREALRCYIQLHYADAAFRLIRDSHLADAVVEDIPSFISLRVPPGKEKQMSEKEFEDATDEAITLLVDEAQHGLVRPNVVVGQLRDKKLLLYLFFYLRGLFKGAGIKEHAGENRDRLIEESKSLVDEFADLAVSLFAKHDRPLLMSFLQSSASYKFDSAVQECESYHYYDELVYLYSKTGQTKRALYLIIDRLCDVPKAIAFARAQDDPELWADLLDYSMDKPRFIRGLLEQVQVGSQALDPVTLVRRIPQGLEIEGLREGIRHIFKEHEIQWSISEGVARVLRSEVAGWQAKLRGGQRRGIKFEVVSDADNEKQPLPPPQSQQPSQHNRQQSHNKPQNTPPRDTAHGKCAHCGEGLSDTNSDDPPDDPLAAASRGLVGFACGHVFHLPHLLDALSALAGESDIRSRRGKEAALLDWAGGHVESPAGSGGSGGYCVGEKVTRARLLRNRIRGGCPVCKARQHAAARV